jgi:hypothetical protein
MNDPEAAVIAAEQAATVLRRYGNRYGLAGAVENQVLALLCTGEWDRADAVLETAVHDYGLALTDLVGASHAWIPGLRGDAERARSLLAEMPDLATTDDPQDRGAWLLVNAWIAVAESGPAAALPLARQALEFLPALGAGADPMRWGWPLASRCAHELDDAAEVERLLALLDEYRPGELPRMLHAERDLARARLAARNNDPTADTQLKDAIASMRVKSTPFHLAHGLLDHAEYLATVGRGHEGAALVEEARQIGERLRAKGLVQRAANAAAGVSV